MGLGSRVNVKPSILRMPAIAHRHVSSDSRAAVLISVQKDICRNQIHVLSVLYNNTKLLLNGMV